MAVMCGQCGEELLGSVNRCWRCGAAVVSHRGNAELPPVRRAPLPAAGSVAGAPAVLAAGEGDAAVLAALSDSPPADTAIVGAASAAESAGAATAARPIVARRVGSPFAVSVFPGERAAASTAAVSFPTIMPEYPRNASAAAGAFAALALGVISLLASLVTVGSIITAGIGIVMGIWGLYSPRRLAAVIGILLCCLGMLGGGYQGFAFVYEARYGYRPFAVPQQVDDFESGGGFEGMQEEANDK